MLDGGWKGNTRNTLVALLRKQPGYRQWHKLLGFNSPTKKQIRAGIDYFSLHKEATDIVMKGFNDARKPNGQDRPPIKRRTKQTTKPDPFHRADITISEVTAAWELLAEAFPKALAALVELRNNPRGK